MENKKNENASDNPCGNQSVVLGKPPTTPDANRRKLLLTATGLLGSASALAVAYTFIDSMEPSARAEAEAGPVDADASKLAEGQLMTVAWRGKPVWVMRRTPAMIQALQQPNAALADPQSKRSVQPAACANATRSIKPELFVAVGICTHLGCSPQLQTGNEALNAELHAPGGFLCPCHGSRFDLAGRVVQHVPAPVNLEIPDYRFTAPDKLVIG